MACPPSTRSSSSPRPRGITVTLPLRCRYVAVTLPLRCRYVAATLPLQLSKIERRSEWDEATETWRIARIQYAGNAMRHKRRDPPRSPGDQPGANPNSPTSRRGLESGDGPPLPDIAAELSSVFFSYQPDPAALEEEEAEALSVEQEAQQEAEMAQRARMGDMRERQRRRQEQSELDAVMGL